MLWVIFAFLTALFVSLMGVASKESLKDVDEYIVAWSLRFFALPFLIPLLAFIDIPSLNNQFFIALIANGSLNLIAFILYMKAIKYSDLSIAVPMIAFTPVFLLVTSPVIVGEFPNIFGILGVLLIVLGSYTLKLKKKGEGYLAPFKALLKERGPRYMLLVAFIWSITSNFDKLGVLNSSPVFWVISVNSFIAAAMLPVVFYRSKNKLKQIPQNLKSLLPVGFFNATSLVFQMTAISLALVSYVISIKRTSILFSVLFGFLIFKEKDVTSRLLGSFIMFAGVLLIILMG